MPLSDPDRLFDLIETLVLHHSPSGAEAEIDRFLLDQFKALGVEDWLDEAGNAIANCIDILKAYCSDVTTCEP